MSRTIRLRSDPSKYAPDIASAVDEEDLELYAFEGAETGWVLKSPDAAPELKAATIASDRDIGVSGAAAAKKEAIFQGMVTQEENRRAIVAAKEKARDKAERLARYEAKYKGTRLFVARTSERLPPATFLNCCVCFFFVAAFVGLLVGLILGLRPAPYNVASVAIYSDGTILNVPFNRSVANASCAASDWVAQLGCSFIAPYLSFDGIPLSGVPFPSSLEVRNQGLIRIAGSWASLFSAGAYPFDFFNGALYGLLSVWSGTLSNGATGADCGNWLLSSSTGLAYDPFGAQSTKNCTATSLRLVCACQAAHAPVFDEAPLIYPLMINPVQKSYVQLQVACSALLNGCRVYAPLLYWNSSITLANLPTLYSFDSTAPVFFTDFVRQRVVLSSRWSKFVTSDVTAYLIPGEPWFVGSAGDNAADWTQMNATTHLRETLIAGTSTASNGTAAPPNTRMGCLCVP